MWHNSPSVIWANDNLHLFLTVIRSLSGSQRKKGDNSYSETTGVGRAGRANQSEDVLSQVL